MKSASKTKRVLLAAIMAGVLCFAVAGCAPKATGGNAGEEPKDEEPTFQINWTINMACDGCHSDHSYVHEAQGVECASCHSDEAALSKVHEKATAEGPMPTRLKATSVNEESCLASGCHDQAEADFKALTAHVETLVDVNNTKANPHDVMTLTPGHVDITCSDCHSEHAGDIDEAMVCVSCHHMGTYECNTCHEAA